MLSSLEKLKYKHVSPLYNSSCCQLNLGPLDLCTLDDDDINSIKAFLITADGGHAASKSTYNRIRASWPQLRISSFYKTRQRIRRLANLNVRSIPMCPRACRAFSRPEQIEQAKHNGCSICSTPVFNSDGHPYLTSDILPILPRILALYANKDMAKVMQTYRHEYLATADPDWIRDVFDTDWYKELLVTEAAFRGIPLGHPHFHRATDVAIGFWADGFKLFKVAGYDCWPLLGINYNLPPSERFLKHNVWLLGIIPKAPKDFNSFVEPIMDEAGELMAGVDDQWNAHTEDTFTAGGYFILASGDQLAVALMTNYKGHRAVSPCRTCRLFGCQCETGGDIPTYYYPLQVPKDWDGEPDLRAARPDGPDYDPNSLPLRDHVSYLHHLGIIDDAAGANKAAAKRAFGINGPCAFTALSSIDFPRSFPFGMAHLICLNTIPNLVRHAIGTFPSVPNDGEPYAVPKEVWEPLCAQLASSSSTVPAEFGRRYWNISKDWGSMVAEDWLNFLLQASRPLFATIYTSEEDRHCLMLWNLLAEIIEDCLDLSLHRSTLDSIRQQIVEFVSQCEE